MPKFVATPSRQHESVDLDLERILRSAVIVGLALVLLLPAARGQSDWLGWMPLWLVGMPAVAWCSLHRFRLPLRRSVVREIASSGRRRRSGAQARRRAMPVLQRFPRAA
ncbi:MAG TPA: hypothetical protein VIT22_03590 [Pseudoxanthomonas sp.]